MHYSKAGKIAKQFNTKSERRRAAKDARLRKVEFEGDMFYERLQEKIDDREYRQEAHKATSEANIELRAYHLTLRVDRDAVEAESNPHMGIQPFDQSYEKL